MALSDDFFQQAKMLVKLDKNRPKQINLRRSTSAAYYAVFHELCLMSAVAIVGKKGALKRAWRQVYRASEHTNLEKNLECKTAFLMKNKSKCGHWKIYQIHFLPCSYADMMQTIIHTIVSSRVKFSRTLQVPSLRSNLCES